MADKAKQFLRSDKLVGLLRQQDYYNKAHYVSDPLYGQAADRIETQAREIERLRDGLSEVRQLIGQPLESALATIAGIDLAAAKALAGDSHD